MSISSISSSVNVTQAATAAQTAPSTSPKQTSEKAEGGATPQAASAPTVLTQGASATHHHKKKPAHPLPGVPGHQLNKTA
jgi:hypothetical protein